jgi:hypothetical protein
MAHRSSLAVGSLFLLVFAAAAPEVANAQSPKPATVVISAQTKMVGEIAEATSLASSLSAGQKAAAASVVAKLRAKKNDDAQAAMQTLVLALAKDTLPPDVLSSCTRAKQTATACKRAHVETEVSAIVQWVLREAYLETNSDLARYADKVRHFNQQKSAIREQLSELRGATSKAGKGKTSVKTVKLLPHAKGKAAFQLVTVQASKSELDALIKKFEEDLSSVGDDAQLANIDLQNQLQKQQQLIQMLSNISKTLHDTAMAVIRKIG